MKTGLVMQQVEYWIPAFARMTDFMTCFVAKHEARMINIRNSRFTLSAFTANQVMMKLCFLEFNKLLKLSWLRRIIFFKL
ncbi:hypothetical protein D4R71_01320 [bacterium]|nr:MAG: hypothetical protein D4R71_01320 [bacterium]